MPRALTEQEIQKFREELCRVAERRFAEEGLAGVTMRGLAQDLGVSPMTPYRYFASKEDVFDAVRRQAFRRFGDRCHEIAAKHRCPIRRLRALGRHYVRFAREEPHAYRIMFQLDPPAIERPPLEEEEVRHGWLVLRQAMEDAVGRGILEGDPVTLAHVTWVSLHGCVTLHLAGKLLMDRSLDDLVEPVIETFLRGSSARPKAEGTPS